MPDSCGTDTVFELDVSDYKYIRIVVVPPKEKLTVNCVIFSPPMVIKPQEDNKPTSKKHSSFDWDSFAKSIEDEMNKEIGEKFEIKQ